jgi:hypothetical protein
MKPNARTDPITEQRPMRNRVVSQLQFFSARFLRPQRLGVSFSWQGFAAKTQSTRS